MSYIEQLHNIQNLSFNSIIELNTSLVPLQYRSCAWLYPGLNHGTAVLTTEEQCNAYIAAYGNMHQGKINEVLDKINTNDFANTDLQIIDWGCGQGLATIESDSCSGCNMVLRPQLIVQATKCKELVYCDNCSRILFNKKDIQE